MCVCTTCTQWNDVMHCVFVKAGLAVFLGIAPHSERSSILERMTRLLESIPFLCTNMDYDSPYMMDHRKERHIIV